MELFLTQRNTLIFNEIAQNHIILSLDDEEIKTRLFQQLIKEFQSVFHSFILSMTKHAAFLIK